VTQRETVLTMLEDAGDRGVTGNTFYANFLPRFPARIFLYRLVKVSVTPTSVDRESLDDRGADLGQSPSTPERQRNRQVADVAGESSTDLGASLPPQPQDAAVAEPRQVTDADGSPGRDPSASLLLFDMPTRLYEDAA
jgi:hypothetical protein